MSTLATPLALNTEGAGTYRGEADRAPFTPTRRLIVLVPAPLVDDAELASQVQALALPGCLSVLLLSKCDRAEDTWAQRRYLATLAAHIRTAPQLHVEAHISPKRAWLGILKSVAIPGDLVVCQRGQTTRAAWWAPAESLAKAIRTQLQVPVCELQDVRSGPRIGRLSGFARAGRWLLALTLIASFGLLQVQFRTLTTGWMTSVVLIGSVWVELLLIAWIASKD